MNYIQRALVLAWLLWSGLAWSALDRPAFEVVQEHAVVVSPNQHSWVYQDPEGNQSVEALLQRLDDFKPASEFKSADAHSYYWVLQKFHSQLTVDREFRLDGNWLSIQTHLMDSQGRIKVLKDAGWLGGYAALSNVDPVLPSSIGAESRSAVFTLHKGETITLLSRVQSLSIAPPKSFVLRLVDNARFLELRRFGIYIEGSLLGILFALSIFGWYSYIWNRDRASLLYAIWISFAFMQMISMQAHDGSRLAEFFINADGIYIGANSLALAITLVAGYGQAFFYFLFAGAFLQFAKYFPRAQKMIYVYTIFMIAHALTSIFVTHNIPTQIYWMPITVFATLIFVVIYLCGLARYRQGMKVAKFFLIAATPYFVFRLIYLSGLLGYSSVFGLLPESGMSYLMQSTNLAQGVGMCFEVIVMALAVVSRNSWIQQELNQSLDNQKTLIENQNKILETAVAERTQELVEKHKALDESHQVVVESVNYASRLQRGQLPRAVRIDHRFASFATLWEPRDTIGGDVYWLSSSQHQGAFIVAVADCTGHGVPGAMLSLLVSNSLERIYANDTHQDPANALMSLDHYVRSGLNQDRHDSESDDGCDAAILRVDRDSKTMAFAGAKLGLFHVKGDGKIARYVGARCSLGYQASIADKDKPGTQVIHYAPGDAFVIATDGITDQVGGPSGRTSYGYRRLEAVLQSHQTETAEAIVHAIKLDFANWQGAQSRRDDVTVVVFKL